MVKVTYKTGDKVFAKVKGYPPWPARVEGDTGKKKYNVLFYGTQETGAIKPEDLCYYSKNKDNYVHKYLKRAGYEDAVKQIEEAIKKDGGDGNDAAGDESVYDVDMSDTSSISSVSEKKTAKRKVVSLPDEPVQKKTTARPRRSMAASDSKEDQIEEPAPKKSRRKSNASTDNGVKEEISEENSRDEKEIEKVEEIELKPSKIGKVEEKSGEESGEARTESEAERSDTVDETEKNEDVESREESPTKSKTDEEESKKPKETEFVEIENNADSSLQMEEEASVEAEKALEKNAHKIEIITEQMLKNNILYAEHVKKNINLYKEKLVENRQDSMYQVLPVKLPSGTICGLKLHKEWPLKHCNESERALYDEKVAKSLLEIKDLLSSKNKSLNEVDAVTVPDIQMTLEDIKELTYGKDIESKRKRLDRLKKEADLVTWDSRIKNNLGLDKALPDAAFDCLKEFSKIEKDLDILMLKKHPHVVDTLRRLCKYVGNVKEWDMTSQDMEIFTRKAEHIRTEADKIYNKIKSIVKFSEEKGTFWETFMDLVSDFRVKCKNLSESEVLVLCAEPDSRQAFLDKLDEVAESEGTAINASNTSEPVLKETSVKGWTEKKIL